MTQCIINGDYNTVRHRCQLFGPGLYKLGHCCFDPFSLLGYNVSPLSNAVVRGPAGRALAMHSALVVPPILS